MAHSLDLRAPTFRMRHARVPRWSKVQAGTVGLSPPSLA